MLAAVVVLAAPSAASAVTVSRAELSGSQLRVEGTAAANAFVTVTSSSGSTATGTAGSSGAFRVEASSFRSDTCQVTVSDGGRTTTAEATLTGCTPATTTTPSTSCAIVRETFGDGNVGTLSTWYFGTTGCRTSEKPVRFNVVSGQIPPGTTLFTQGVSSGGITGRPTTEGLFAFTIRVQDQTGATDTESFPSGSTLRVRS